jgi:hypothetical protein
MKLISWNLAGRLRHIPQQAKMLSSREPDMGWMTTIHARKRCNVPTPIYEAWSMIRSRAAVYYSTRPRAGIAIRYCHIDKVLGNAPSKPVTIARFYLPRVQTIFRTDMHNTNNSEGAFLVF